MGCERSCAGCPFAEIEKKMREEAGRANKAKSKGGKDKDKAGKGGKD